MPAVINQFPQVGNAIPIFFTYIDNNSNLQQADILSMSVLYGSANINGNIVIPTQAEELAIAVTASAGQQDILYLNPVPQRTIPNLRQLLIQKFPQGIFNDFSNSAIVGNIVSAQAAMLTDYYGSYIGVLNEIFSTVYNPAAEFQYNGTMGLLSDSFDSDRLILLLHRLKQVKLTTYWLELFISQYIYYRTGVSCAVYIDDGIQSTSGYWDVDISELDTSTVLAPSNLANPVIKLVWTIYNSGSLTTQLQQEIQLLINRISRCTMQNIATFSGKTDPTQDGFVLVGPTYELDPNMLYGRCIQFLGDEDFPLNIIGYVAQ